jgi:two-component system cell cycle response regulator
MQARKGSQMQAKVLIVDAVATNRIMLTVTLSAAFYDVASAPSLDAALARMHTSPPDLVILSGDLPQNGAFDFCKAMKSDTGALAVPIVMIGAKDTPAFRLQALEAGAQDILSKPVEDSLLLARIRSLLRAQATTQELRLRDGTSRALGFCEDASRFESPGRIALIATDLNASQQLADAITPGFAHNAHAHSIKSAMGAQEEQNTPDVFVIALTGGIPDPGLRLLADIRARARTRHAAIIVITPAGCQHTAADAFDLGADDAMPDGVDAAEFTLRLTVQLSRKRQSDRLRETMRSGAQAAVTDPLTGLYNRRYALPHLARIMETAMRTDKPFAVMIADLDHFKSINDRFGHAVGDAVLIDVAQRLRRNLRAVDLVARFGGEEFLIVMPNTGLKAARAAAHRLCNAVQETPVVSTPVASDIQPAPLVAPLHVTISIGVAIAGAPDTAPFHPDMVQADAVSRVLDAADQALYKAKDRGRNCVRMSRPAA